MTLYVQLKTCAYPGCDHEFPEHFFAAHCASHSYRDIVLVEAQRAFPDVPASLVEVTVDVLLCQDHLVDERWNACWYPRLLDTVAAISYGTFHKDPKAYSEHATATTKQHRAMVERLGHLREHLKMHKDETRYPPEVQAQVDAYRARMRAEAAAQAS